MNLILSKLNVRIRPEGRDSMQDPEIIAEVRFLPDSSDSDVYENEDAIRNCIWHALQLHKYEVKIPKTEKELMQEKIAQLEKRVGELEVSRRVAITMGKIEHIAGNYSRKG